MCLIFPFSGDQKLTFFILIRKSFKFHLNQKWTQQWHKLFGYSGPVVLEIIKHHFEIWIFARLCISIKSLVWLWSINNQYLLMWHHMSIYCNILSFVEALLPSFYLLNNRKCHGGAYHWIRWHWLACSCSHCDKEEKSGSIPFHLGVLKISTCAWIQMKSKLIHNYSSFIHK